MTIFCIFRYNAMEPGNFLAAGKWGQRIYDILKMEVSLVPLL